MANPRRDDNLALRIGMAIAQREIRLASRRKLVRALFVTSLIPLVIFAIVLIAEVASKAALGMSLGWDPVHQFLGVQSFPVMLLSMAIGAPMVALDRAEDVLFLYATRRVRPLDYALGKWAAVALPASLLLLLPGLLMAGMRWGILPDVDAVGSAWIAAKVVATSLLVGAGYGGVALAASALTQRGRWALLLALGLLFGPEIGRGFARTEWPLGPMHASTTLIRALFGDGRSDYAVLGACLLAACAIAGVVLCATRVRKEMIP